MQLNTKYLYLYNILRLKNSENLEDNIKLTLNVNYERSVVEVPIPDPRAKGTPSMVT